MLYDAVHVKTQKLTVTNLWMRRHDGRIATASTSPLLLPRNHFCQDVCVYFTLYKNVSQ